jgi:hypothetical protein
MFVNPNQFRHFTNDTASRSAIPIEIITAWSGRVDANQTHEYIHQSDTEKTDRISSIINPSSVNKDNILVIATDEISNLANLPASITSTGICTQELNVTPCDFLNDFVTQCFMCPSACYVCGDKKSIVFLEKDFSYQKQRLTSVTNDPRFTNSPAMKSWFSIHKRNIVILSKLIEILKTYTPGSIVRYSNQLSEFKLTDLKKKLTKTITLKLPDPEKEIRTICKKQSKTKDNDSNKELTILLSKFNFPLEDT